MTGSRNVIARRLDAVAEEAMGSAGAERWDQWIELATDPAIAGASLLLRGRGAAAFVRCVTSLLAGAGLDVGRVSWDRLTGTSWVGLDADGLPVHARPGGWEFAGEEPDPLPHLAILVGPSDRLTAGAWLAALSAGNLLVATATGGSPVRAGGPVEAIEVLPFELRGGELLRLAVLGDMLES